MATGHHTKDKGDLAVVKVHADLVEKGAVVLVPLTEHAPFDLVAYLDASFYRVQVKYRRLTRGSVNVEFVSTWADRHGIHKRPMPRDQVDVVAIYCPDTGDTYYVNPRDFRGSVTLRVTPPRNGQQLRVLPVSQFLTMPPVDHTRRAARAASARRQRMIVLRSRSRLLITLNWRICCL